jgi:hypothetical protein
MELMTNSRLKRRVGIAFIVVSVVLMVANGLMIGALVTKDLSSRVAPILICTLVTMFVLAFVGGWIFAANREYPAGDNLRPRE